MKCDVRWWVICVIEVSLDTSKVSHRRIKFMWANMYMCVYELLKLLCYGIFFFRRNQSVLLNL